MQYLVFRYVHSKEPAIAEKDKTFCVSLLCCYASDPLKIVVRTPVGGYTPGQVINLEVNVNNQSDQPVSDFTVQLIKVKKFMWTI